MFSRSTIKTTFEAEQAIQPIYSGGDVALGGQGRILTTCFAEEALITDLHTGKLLARIEGVSLRFILEMTIVKRDI